MIALHFRPLREHDLAAMHALHGDPATNAHNPFGADPDLATTRRILEGWRDHERRHGFGYRAVESDGEVIGICGARHDDWHGTAVINLYWRLLPEFWGRGLSAPLAAHALEIARSRPGGGDQPIVARMREDNAASQRVAERAGLVPAPHLARDGWIVYVDA